MSTTVVGSRLVVGQDSLWVKTRCGLRLVANPNDKLLINLCFIPCYKKYRQRKYNMKFTHSFLVYNLSYRIICYSRLCTAEYSFPITINISTEQISFWETSSLQLVKNFIVFHGHKKFITGFTSACKLLLFWAKFILFNIRVIKTNLMYYLFSVYFVNQPLHVSGIFVAHHQEVYCIYTTIATCCAFQLTVCWPAANRQTDVPRCTFNIT